MYSWKIEGHKKLVNKIIEDEGFKYEILLVPKTGRIGNDVGLNLFEDRVSSTEHI